MEPTARLTELAPAGGCAAKYSAARLEELLRGFAPVESENLLVGLAPADDAAVYRLDDERALIFTVDFFPPLVDDPAEFGAIAATNALNDVFAMGGAPLLALSVAAFPEELPGATVAAVLSAADAKVREAGALLAGGHTIRDPEPKYGLAVVGTASPDAIWRKSEARPGDALYLTKPLGTGLVLTGVKQGLLPDTARAQAVSAMTELNRDAADVLRPHLPHAVTDVTGFGLFGHSVEIAERSGVRLVLEASRLPALEGALEAARAGIRTGGDPRNREFAADRASTADIPDELELLGYDPQTAGGLLVSLPAAHGPVLEAEFRDRGLFLARIGCVEAGQGVLAV
ncbi:MAG: selenide, water dikinase SelD [Gaiellales bacterium]